MKLIREHTAYTRVYPRLQAWLAPVPYIGRNSLRKFLPPEGFEPVRVPWRGAKVSCLRPRSHGAVLWYHIKSRNFNT